MDLLQALVELVLASTVGALLWSTVKKDLEVRDNRLELKAGRGFVLFLDGCLTLFCLGGLAYLFGAEATTREATMSLLILALIFIPAGLAIHRCWHQLEGDNLICHGLFTTRSMPLEELLSLEYLASHGAIQLTDQSGARTRVYFHQSGIPALLHRLKERRPDLEPQIAVLQERYGHFEPA